ncbi:MAG TPA: LacI family DNA-binding transcriptional regulator [Gaiella sp.]|uniref:LacI family DNA-binding transcriptional regulator n=1 Tax=Gaiella sp. TaxID=2663207 RepID=UPI002D80D517|nr:LacI family DNA-binding transcriptional regulator [Gaiella sp.]HET9288367.1 LacI family DNA-binding transcriptional regulator [Gaiella sp.]
MSEPAQREAVNHGRATIRDVARRAGVSVATVSRVVNDRPDVSPETREAVLEVVRALSFSTNRSARALSKGRTGLVGLTIPFVLGDYYSLILSGATEALHEQEMRAVLCPTRHEHDREAALVERLMRGTTDGAIIVLPSESPGELSDLAAQGFPFVVVDAPMPLPERIPVVSATHWAGARAATEHLLQLGHRRIGIVTGREGWVATEERRDGYQAALAAAGVLASPELVRSGNFEIPDGHAGARELLALDDPPTAIFACNDNMAVGVLRAAAEAGLRVPGDLSIVGFDDSELARVTTPALTTVRQPLEEMGRMAVSLLSRLIDGQRVETLRVELATRLVVRGSTAPPP